MPTFEKLRDEIIESEKARTDLMKWKLILVAAIGAAGLGIGSNEHPCVHRGILLAFIPFVCLYVDAVCFHNEIRIMAISRFLRFQNDNLIEKQYENYCVQHRDRFSLETFALLVTTLVLSALIYATGRSRVIQELFGMPNDSAMSIAKYSGVFGMLLGFLFYLIYFKVVSTLDHSVIESSRNAGST